MGSSDLTDESALSISPQPPRKGIPEDVVETNDDIVQKPKNTQSSKVDHMEKIIRKKVSLLKIKTNKQKSNKPQVMKTEYLCFYLLFY